MKLITKYRISASELLHDHYRTTAINGSIEQECIVTRCVSSLVETLPADLSTAGSQLAVFE